MKKSPHDDAMYTRRGQVARMINRAQAALVDRLDTALAPFDITAAQYVVLSTLSSGRANIAAQICKEISYSPGAMTRMLNRLEQKGMIRKRPDEDSKRTIKLELTEEGKRQFPGMLEASSAVIDEFFGAFEPHELDAFEALLAKMISKD